MPDRTLRPRSGRSAKALLLTMLGEFVLPHEGTIWTSAVIDGLGLLGVGERNARQAAARLGDEGVIVSERIGRSARWSLTARGRSLLEAGTRRINAFGAAPGGWDGQWLVVLAPVSEDERAKRHQLRARLAFAGFGFIGPGVAISPHADREPVATEILRDLDLVDSAIVFRATTGLAVPDDTIIERAWDLDGLARRYESFANEFGRRQPESPGETFAAVVELVHEWRRFPFDDPEIPLALLPAAWPGRSAKVLFDRQRARWTPAATEWYLAASDQESSTAS